MGLDYERYAQRVHFHGSYRHPKIFFSAVNGRSGTFLDVGAGDGNKLRSAIDAKALSSFTDIRAFDISKERVERLRRLIPEAVSSVGDAQAIPMPDGSVDFYYSDQVIEHVPNDAAQASEAHRLLRPGGRGFIGSVVKGKGAWYFYRCKGQWRLDPTHIREYDSLAQFERIFVNLGLSVIDSTLEPLKVSATDILLRGLLRMRLMKTNDSINVYQRSAALRRISALMIPIPRYYLCYVTIQKPLEA